MTTLRGTAASLLLIASLVSACAGAVASPPPTGAAPTAPPSGDTSPGASPDQPITGGGGGSGPVGPGQPTLVLPKPGQRNVHPVAIEELSARVAGRHVVLNARWWSGVEPCNVLDSVAVKKDGNTFTVSVREGTGDGNGICIEIAMLKATPIDLGELDPGVYTVVAGEGTAPPITVTVP